MPPSKSTTEELIAIFQVQEFLRRLDAVGDRIGQLASAVAVAAEREKHLAQELAEINEKLDDFDKRTKALEFSALKTSVGLAVIVAIGGVIGWIISSWSGVISFFRGLVKHAS